jgi:hypothetical protein
MSDEPKKRSRVWIGWVLLAVFVLYPLSIGPAFWIVGKHPESIEVWRSVYTPIIWACESKTLRGWVNRYLSLWVDLT